MTAADRESHKPGPDDGVKPRHIAIIMDGNGRWAAGRGRPRHQGHRAGAEAARRTVEYCLDRGIPCLTLFAFSSENWRRPPGEVRMLMELFLRALERETGRLAENGVRLRFIGDHERLAGALRERMADAARRTAGNEALTVNVAVGYGGRWDIARAAHRLAARVAEGSLDADAVDERTLAGELCLADLPEPDLFIRTGGERRISNFLIWQLAYTELYFCDVLWPDFGADALDEALAWFRGRQRRFGMTAEQLGSDGRA
ncbi:Ditrans,polycis-undecaprenyl-diphosphate synthase ((2E,6E)-farnesyl-diphosphate specific) [wastewater metagenome]|uniref:Ditrans,polycis-undecaprenyl-diphosphate synthase ((2E,6E)-farnesyl-diphosphate specific) n=2 Tax=unclassified sequences TaxID=12908 RepID=A0A5B8R9H8_9ZZZZ|nr:MULTISPECIES: polyprenyl diphosphate synthase [Arhodomonas]MCS4505658.1 polyprenyl diphosphate synthase [Arhodomonas aquaeolei]QEA04643.1 ditrans,polycis-undecaprenyl-diphosphate synthase ((2E,6E)-farnesyl-diphosphate specific) [uncultured organism]